MELVTQQVYTFGVGYVMEENRQAAASQDDMSLSENLNYVTSAIVGPILCIMGMVGNFLSLAVWTRARMRCSTAIYLTGQSIADIGVLVTFLLCDTAQAWAPSIMHHFAYGAFYSYIGYPFVYITAVLSVWITVGVTVDRYIMVCWVTKAKSICSEGRTGFVLLMMSLCVLVVNIPNFIFYAPVGNDITAGNSSSNVLNPTTPAGVQVVESGAPRLSFELTAFGASYDGYFFEFWIHCMLVLLVPWITVFTLNLLIIQKIIQSNRRMQDKKSAMSLEKSRRSEHQITRLLLTVTFSFLFFMGFQCVVQCFWMLKPSNVDWPAVNASFAFGKIGIVFSSSLNFMFYCMTGKRFRKELSYICGFKKSSLGLSSLVGSSSSVSSRLTDTSGM